MNQKLYEFKQKMYKTGCGESIISLFLRYYEKLKNGDRGIIYEKDIYPVKYGEITKYCDIEKDKTLLEKTAIIKLNGGLGTSMGMDFPKSFVEVREKKRFIDIALLQQRFFEKETKSKYPLIFMNSLSTKKTTEEFVEKNPQILCKDIPPCFTQHSFVKVLKDGFGAAFYEKDTDLEYNPAGHGDVYMALHESGILKKLLKNNFRFAFISNIDNSAASFDVSISNFMAKNDIPFLMEVCRRTDMDKKGGHIAKNKNGGYVLRERAQADENEMSEFENIEKYSYFNTNSIWVDLRKLGEIIDRNKIVELPFIANEKTLNPNDKSTDKVYQIEQAMGAAISLFEGAKLLEVEKERFFPVKTTSDLFLLRSDRFFIKDSVIKSFDDNKSECSVVLENKFYSNLSDFEKRVSKGVPSLKGCKKLFVRNDVFFDETMKFDGEVYL
ncbi:MAG: UTP--glucose-1-phosphate uridylyltransferase [Chitinispirillales bacterium]|jgi:UTP--glucose-1-phosphate uridylyltransferase|nr:UTP--glucose-1-phosphate uridylyltransferase [Chitinispirillales bacterium]